MCFVCFFYFYYYYYIILLLLLSSSSAPPSSLLVARTTSTAFPPSHDAAYIRSVPPTQMTKYSPSTMAYNPKKRPLVNDESKAYGNHTGKKSRLSHAGIAQTVLVYYVDRPGLPAPAQSKRQPTRYDNACAYPCATTIL